MADPTDRTSIDDLTDAVAEWWRFNTFGARFESEMHPSFASSARQILDCIQAFLRGRGLLLGPDGLLRAETVNRWIALVGPHAFSVHDNPTCNCGAALWPLFVLSPLDPPEDTP